MAKTSDIQHLPRQHDLAANTNPTPSSVIVRGRQAATRLLRNSPKPQGAEEQYLYAKKLIEEASKMMPPAEHASGEEWSAFGDQTREKFREALEWLGKAAEQCHVEAQFLLGAVLLMDEGFIFVRDEAKAAKWIREAANQGHVGAQETLGKLYRDGRGVEQDAKEATRWFTKAAEQGDEDAQFALGSMYFAGDGVKRNNKKAAIWIRKSAEQGVALAQFQLALFYLNGQGVAQDVEEAVKWARSAAAGGCNTAKDFLEDAEAQFKLALAYLRGEGVEPDATTAVDWARKAAKQDYPPALCFLGEAYFYGDGVRENRAEANNWYRKAAKLGDFTAQTRLFATEGAVVLGTLQKP